MFSIWRQAATNMANSSAMPTSLRYVTAIAMIAFVVTTMIVVTASVISGFGNPTTPFTYMWRSGAWVPTFIWMWMLLICISCLGVAARRPAFRWILVLSPIVMETLSVAHVGLRVFDVASAIFWGASCYAYLFHAPSLRRYFAAAES